MMMMISEMSQTQAGGTWDATHVTGCIYADDGVRSVNTAARHCRRCQFRHNAECFMTPKSTPPATRNEMLTVDLKKGFPGAATSNGC